MTFKPYETYRNALPVLKVGHVIKAGAGSKGGSGFWIIKKVMEGRIKITEAAPATKKQWISKNGEIYKQVSGNVDTEKVVHLQYLACLDAAEANVYWGKDPLFSLDTESVVNNVIAPDTSPVRLDRWSYDQSMFLAVSIASGSQNFLLETVNYEVEPLKGAAPGKYLEITSEGNATFVEEESRKSLPKKPKKVQFGERGEGED